MSRPWPPELSAALRRSSRGTSLRALDRLYKELPPTTGEQRGLCCGLLPPGQPIEIIAWLCWFLEQPPGERASLAARLVEHFLVNAAQRRPCPWAEPGACAIYARRFFGCRAYGLWSQDQYARRAAQAAAAQEGVVEAWSGLGVLLPEEVLAPPPPYCQEAAVADGENRPMTDADLLRLEERLTGLGPDLPWLAACGGDLSHTLARLALGEGECLRAKMEITRCLLGGHSELAERLLDQARQTAREWAAAPPPEPS